MVNPTNEEIAAFKGDWESTVHSSENQAPGADQPECELLQRTEALIEVHVPQKVIDLARKEPKRMVKTREGWKYGPQYGSCNNRPRAGLRPGFNPVRTDQVLGHYGWLMVIMIYIWGKTAAPIW